MSTHLKYGSFSTSTITDATQKPCAYLVFGEKELLNLTQNKVLASALPSAVVSANVSEPLFHPLGEKEENNENSNGGSVVHFHYKETDANGKQHLQQVIFATLTNEKTRHNAILRGDLVQEIVQKNTPKDVSVRMLVCLKSVDQAFAAGAAIARGFPLYNQKTSSKKKDRTLYIEFITGDGKPADYKKIQATADGVRFAARLTDMPTSELHTDAYVEEAYQVQKRLESFGVKIMVKQGEVLNQEGFGGLWGVGKAAEHLPALVILTYEPKEVKKTVCWVGKGIVYDTGGLSIKGKEFMPTMKCDMAGSAAILAAFEATVKLGCPHRLYAILCLAENSVDAKSTRPDDILYMYSGKTVEINNTDAEGRLVLADGVAYATKHLNPDYIMDLATLTGAQSYATGKAHSGVLSNNEDLETVVVQSGKTSGDLVFPLLYAPEFLGIAKQFASEVADMKNSVKDRGNAASSCAGHFIEEHLVGDQWGWNSKVSQEKRGKFAHLDIAAPAFVSGRGTGYGVALLVDVVQHL